MKAPRLTKEQARQVRSLVDDGGWSKQDARDLVLMGIGELAANPKVKTVSKPRTVLDLAVAKDAQDQLDRILGVSR